MTNPWWRVTGAWPNDSSSDILVGERLAKRRLLKTGDEVWLSEPYPVAHAPGETIRVSGILSTGGPEDDEIVAPLGLAQRLLGKPGAVRRVYVSALTKPEDALARRDPKSM